MGRTERNTSDVGEGDLFGELPVLAYDFVKHLLRILNEVHLVDGNCHMSDPKQGDEIAVAAGLNQNALTCGDQDDREVCRGAPVTMLRVYCSCPGVSGDDVGAPVSGEVAVGDVDGDALLALGGQPSSSSA